MTIYENEKSGDHKVVISCISYLSGKGSGYQGTIPGMAIYTQYVCVLYVNRERERYMYLPRYIYFNVLK
jgi:hypothetical protein